MEMPKIAKRFEVLNKAADQNETTIYMYGSIGDGWYADISANDVRSQLNAIESDTINIHLNSPGGDVFESIAISNLLKDHKAKIIVTIDALAASGGSVIAMGADQVIMKKNAMMMIHKAWTYAAGNSIELTKIANDLEKMDSAVTESYTSRFVGERSELEQLLADETWLTAEECLALGFCDEVTDLEQTEEPVQQLNAKEAVLNKYGNQTFALNKANNENIQEPVLHNEPNKNETKDESADLMSAFFNVLN